MYNENFKTKYIKSGEYSEDVMKIRIIPLFDKIEKEEESNGKDVYDFSLEEIINLYKSFNSHSGGSLMTYNSILKAYTNYGIKMGVVKDNTNHFLEVTRSAIFDQCVNKLNLKKGIISREKLKEITSEMVNPHEVFVMYALFEGICGKEYSDLAPLTMENFKGNMVYLPSGRKFEVSDELLRAAEESAESTKYYGFTKDGNLKEIKFMFGDNKIIKDRYNCYSGTIKAGHMRVFNLLRRIVKNYDLEGITVTTLLESGRIDMIKWFMRKDESEDVRQTLLNHRDDIYYRYGNLYNVELYLTKYKDFF